MSMARSHHPLADTCGGQPIAGVLARLQSGAKRKDVAREFGVSISTVAWHATKHGIDGRTMRNRVDRDARAKVVASLRSIAAKEIPSIGMKRFVLRHRPQFSFGEIAEALGVTRNTVIGIYSLAKRI